MTTFKNNNILEVAKNLEGKKVLYFEGAGMDFEQSNLNQSDVLNHRIRTSFYNNDGTHYYLEMGNVYQRDRKGKSTEKMMMRIDHLFRVKDRTSQEASLLGGYEIKTDWKELSQYSYTKENLTKWINHNLNCSFDTIHVLDDMYGYYVHGEKGSYVPMETIELNHELVAQQREAFNNYYEWYKRYRKFPCLTVTEKGNNYIKVKTHESKEKIAQYKIEREKVLHFDTPATTPNYASDLHRKGELDKVDAMEKLALQMEKESKGGLASAFITQGYRGQYDTFGMLAQSKDYSNKEGHIVYDETLNKAVFIQDEE